MTILFIEYSLFMGFSVVLACIVSAVKKVGVNSSRSDNFEGW